MKTYLVQTWAESGALENNYEVVLESQKELDHLRKFLRTKSSHVVITAKPAAKKAARR